MKSMPMPMPVPVPQRLASQRMRLLTDPSAGSLSVATASFPQSFPLAEPARADRIARCAPTSKDPTLSRHANDQI